MRHVIIFFFFIVLSGYTGVVFADDEGSSALPAIPQNDTPASLRGEGKMVPQATHMKTKTEQKPSRIFNPLHAVLEKEEKQKSGNQTKRWVNKTEQERLEAEKAKDAAEDTAEAPAKDTKKAPQEVAHRKTEEKKADKPLEDLNEEELKDLQKRVSSQIAQKQKDSEDADIAPATTPKESRQTLSPQIKKVQKAAKSIQKPQKPARLWNIE